MAGCELLQSTGSPVPRDLYPAGRWGHSASTLNLVLICQGSQRQKQKALCPGCSGRLTLEWLFALSIQWCWSAALQWAHCCVAVTPLGTSQLPWASQSSSFTWATCLTSSRVILSSGTWGDFHGNWWPFSTTRLCQGWLCCSITPGCWSCCPSVKWEHSITAGTFSSVLKKLQRISGCVVVSPENHLCLFMLYCWDNITEYSGNIAVYGLFFFIYYNNFFFRTYSKCQDMGKKTWVFTSLYSFPVAIFWSCDCQGF